MFKDPFLLVIFLDFDLNTILERFDTSVLSRVRGKAHDVIIGEWARLWISDSPNSRLVFNPSPYAQNKTADLLFMHDPEGSGAYQPVGVAEIENDENSWEKKIQSLQEYEREIPELKFALLGIKVWKDRLELFDNVLVLIKKVSEGSKLQWVLDCLIVERAKEDVNLYSLRENDEVVSSSTGFIVGRKWAIVRDSVVI